MAHDTTNTNRFLVLGAKDFCDAVPFINLISALFVANVSSYRSSTEP